MNTTRTKRCKRQEMTVGQSLSKLLVLLLLQSSLNLGLAPAQELKPHTSPEASPVKANATYARKRAHLSSKRATSPVAAQVNLSPVGQTTTLLSDGSALLLGGVTPNGFLSSAAL